MNAKLHSMYDLEKRFTVPQWLVLHVVIDIVPRNKLWPELLLLDQELAFDSNFVKGNYTLC